MPAALPAKEARFQPTSTGPNEGESGGLKTGSGLHSTKSGELLSEDAKLVELKVANGR